jgi:Zn-dependent peptidase ImmA (M78 family)
MSNLYLEQAANDFRTTSGLGPCEPIRMKSWLLKMGVLAVFRPLSDGFSGMAVKHGSFKFMLINSNHRMSKQHFTIAHELYHLFIQDNFTSELSKTGLFDKKNPIEYQADCFAAYLLMPKTCLLSLIPTDELKEDAISIATIVKMEQYFACSRAALLFRLKELKLMSATKYADYKNNVEQSAALLGYDTTLYKKANHNLVIGNYGVLAHKLFDKEVISESHYANLMLDIGIDLSNIVMSNEQE